MLSKLRGRLINLIGILIVISLFVSLFGVVRKNYQLSREVKALEEQISILSAEQEELGYRIQYYASDAYKEKEARAKLGLQKPGEEVIILPQTPSQEEAETNQKPTGKSNFQQWREFLFGTS